MQMIERWTTLKDFFELPMCFLSISEREREHSDFIAIVCF